VLSSRFFLALNILSEILINSEIIPKCHKLFEARHNTQNVKIAMGTMVIISTNFEIINVNCKGNFSRHFLTFRKKKL
jgi:hypothetical protein